MSEKTLIIIKPDAVQRNLCGEIITRFEKKGFKMVAAKFMQITKELAQKHYAVHVEKPFFNAVCEYLSSAPVMVMVWEGKDIIELSRKLMGATFAIDAQPGTIRGDFSCSKGYNLIHGSDSQESADYEISLYFQPHEIVEYNLSLESWLLGNE